MLQEDYEQDLLWDDFTVPLLSTTSSPPPSHPHPHPQIQIPTPSKTAQINNWLTDSTHKKPHQLIFESNNERYTNSPTPSSSASMVCSESEEEGFDDLEIGGRLVLGVQKDWGVRRDGFVEDGDDGGFDEDGLDVPDFLERKDWMGGKSGVGNDGGGPLFAGGVSMVPFESKNNLNLIDLSFFKDKFDDFNEDDFNEPPILNNSSQIESTTLTNTTQLQKLELHQFQENNKIDDDNFDDFEMSNSPPPTIKPQQQPPPANQTHPAPKPSSTPNNHLPTLTPKKKPPTTPNYARPTTSSLSQQKPTSRSSTPLHRPPSSIKLTRPKRRLNYGDGSELDQFDDLKVEKRFEERFVKGAPSSRKVGVMKGTEKGLYLNSFRGDVGLRGGGGGGVKLGVRLHHHKKKCRVQPTLIRNMNTTNEVQVIGEMIYNPIHQKWEGNETSLTDFETPTSKPSSIHRRVSRPSLIPPSQTPTTQKHGEMVFDPVQMRWVGNEMDSLVFENIDDCTGVVEGKRNDNDVGGSEFLLSKREKEGIVVAESGHKLGMGKWYPKAVTESKTMVRDTSKTFLYEIRNI